VGKGSGVLAYDGEGIKLWIRESWQDAGEYQFKPAEMNIFQ
jgi:hypothetical protein